MKILGTIIAIIFVVFCGALFIFLSINLWDIFKAIYSGAKTLKPEIYVPLTVTVSTAILGLAATLITQAQSRRREIEAAHRERKLEIYLEFMEMFQHMLLASKKETGTQNLSEVEIIKKLIHIRSRAVLWGSPQVLKTLADFTHLQHNGKNIVDVMDKIQREMRKDLGLSNMGLEQHFFTKLVLSNPNEIEQLKAKIKDTSDL